MIRSAISIASSGSCVTMMAVTPRSFKMSWVSRRSLLRSPVSRPEKGSSSRSRRGLGARARARATRCCSPPESSCGIFIGMMGHLNLAEDFAAAFLSLLLCSDGIDHRLCFRGLSDGGTAHNPETESRHRVFAGQLFAGQRTQSGRQL